MKKKKNFIIQSVESSFGALRVDKRLKCFIISWDVNVFVLKIAVVSSTRKERNKKRKDKSI